MCSLHLSQHIVVMAAFAGAWLCAGLQANPFVAWLAQGSLWCASAIPSFYKEGNWGPEHRNGFSLSKQPDLWFRKYNLIKYKCRNLFVAWRSLVQLTFLGYKIAQLFLISFSFFFCPPLPFSPSIPLLFFPSPSLPFSSFLWLSHLLKGMAP